MKRLMLMFVLPLMCLAVSAAERTYSLRSPDGRLNVAITDGENICYALYHDGDLLIDASEVSMTLADGYVYGHGQEKPKVTNRTVDEVLPTHFYKKAEVCDNFNEITLKYRRFSLVFRAYNEGVAYRFVSHEKVPFVVKDECAEFNFAQDWNMWATYVKNRLETLETQLWHSHENWYKYHPLSEYDQKRLAFLPLMVDASKGRKIVVTEAELMDYPGMHLYNYDGGKTLKGRYANYPERMEQGGHNELAMVVMERGDYIAKYESACSFPWRVISVSENDAQMADNDMVWKLASAADPAKDWSWVKPGKVAWDWWNNWNLYDVDFRAGINNDTYKYYIDFASENGVEYVILDEGWAVNKKADLFQVVPEIDLPMLTEYAAERNVGLILWAGYWAFDRDMERVCEHYSKMGIKGFKVDFMDRDDQIMVDFHRRAAEMCAKYGLLVNFHGTYKPTGLHKTYPNVLNFEGVNGLERMKKYVDEDREQVEYDVTLPFVRMVAGPFDYTQGAMRNATKTNYRAVYDEAMSEGTRCRQLAEFVVFESPLSMLCDSPSNYKREPECTRFIASVPNVWDETNVLCGKVSDYIAIARRSGEEWYVGAMTDWDARELELDLTFLPAGEYTIEIFRDGINADRVARDYKRVVEDFVPGKVNIHMAPGGGWAARIVRK